MESEEEDTRYRIDFTSAAERDFENLVGDTKSRIDRKIQKLRDNPRPSGVDKLEGTESQYRVRVGDYRIIYEINDAVKLVTIARIRNRREVYRNR